MSLARHDGAVLEGFGHPHYSAQAEELTRLLGSIDNLNDFVLRDMGIQVYGDHNEAGRFIDLEPCVTGDCYTWLKAIHFTVNGGSVWLSVPFYRDTTMTDGTDADRCVAIYRSDVSPDMIEDAFLPHLLRTFRSLIEQPYAPIMPASS